MTNHDERDAFASLDYGDPRLWRQSDPPGGAAAGWEWLGRDEPLVDRGGEFARAAVDALTAGEELLARDLRRLARDDIEPD